VDVEETFYQRNQVALTPAEKKALKHQPEQHSKQHSSLAQSTMGKDNNSDTVDSDISCQELRLTGRQTDLPQLTGSSPPTAHYRTTSGRLAKVPNRLDL